MCFFGKGCFHHYSLSYGTFQKNPWRTALVQIFRLLSDSVTQSINPLPSTKLKVSISCSQKRHWHFILAKRFSIINSKNISLQLILPLSVLVSLKLLSCFLLKVLTNENCYFLFTSFSLHLRAKRQIWGLPSMTLKKKFPSHSNHNAAPFHTALTLIPKDEIYSEVFSVLCINDTSQQVLTFNAVCSYFSLLLTIWHALQIIMAFF